VDGPGGVNRQDAGTPRPDPCGLLGLPQFGGHISNGEDVHMARKKRRQYTPEYKAEAIRQVNVGDRSMSQVSRDLGLRMNTLWEWVHQAEVDAGKGEPEELTTTEREELKQLRREVARLREEREILKKATAFFAKENK
jgi:transposase